MPASLALVVFVAGIWLIWIFIGWLSRRLRGSVAIAGAAAGVYALAFFVTLVFVVVMYGYLVRPGAGVLPPAFATPALVLALALVIVLPGGAAWRLFHLCRHRAHKPPTVRRVMGHKSPTAHGAPPPGHKPPTIRRVPMPKPPRRP